MAIKGPILERDWQNFSENLISGLRASIPRVASRVAREATLADLLSPWGHFSQCRNLNTDMIALDIKPMLARFFQADVLVSMGAFFFFGEAFDAVAVLPVITFLSGRCSDTDSVFEAACLDLDLEAIAGKVSELISGVGRGSDTGLASATACLPASLGSAPMFDSLSGAPFLCFSHWTILGVNCF